MYYNFIYPDVRVNPDYKFDEVMSGYNYNFSIINNWQYSGAAIGGVVLSGGSVIATSISATTYYGLPSTSGLYLPLSGGSVVGNTNITGVFRITGNTTTYGNLTSLGATSSYTATPLTINPGTYTTFLQKYYLKIHPESSNNFIPYFINDIGYLTLRGGSVTSDYTGITQTQIETIFDGSPKYASFNPSLLGTGMTLNISFGENFNFTNALAISFGATNWRAQDFIVELVSGGTYSTLDIVTGYTESDYLIEFSLPSLNTFNGLRVTFSNFFNTSSPTGFRIADISLIGFNSNGPKSLYVGRDGGAVYKPLSVTGATESRPSYSIYNDEDTGMYSPTANTLGFATNGTEKLRIDSTGRIDVGTKSPLFRLHVSGDTKLEGGLTATSISATTYPGLPTDIRVTGGTYSAGTATFTNNTGGTFSVTGFSTATTFTGGTVNGPTIFTNGLTATSTLTSQGAFGNVKVDAGSSQSMIVFSGSGTVGGTGYTDFIKVTNTAVGATNINKTFRVNNTGGLEIVNSAYSALTLSLSDSGNLIVGGTVTPQAWTAGQVIKDTILSNTDVTVSTTTIGTSGSDTDFITYSYTPVSSNSYLIIHYHLAKYDATAGAGNDSWFSRIKVDGGEITFSWQTTVNGFRSGALFPLTGRYTNSSTAAKSIVVACRRDSADDSITITNSSTSMWLRITEIAR